MTGQLLTISSFARLVGLTPSALRFYDDCGLLQPAEVDEGNGYRYYSPEQEARATMLRDLREIDLPLADVRVVLDSGPEAAAEVIRTHLRSIELRAEAARQAAARILKGSAGSATSVTLGGAELASAIRQVSPSAATSSSEFPALTCVLMEIGPDEVKLVATDRYRLSVRQLHPKAFSGADCSVLLPAGALTDLIRTLAAAPEIQIDVTPDGVAIGPVVLTSAADEYPAYQAILDGLDAPTSRLFVNRPALLATLETLTGDLVLTTTPVGLTVASSEQEVEVDAICTGTPVRVGFDARLLGSALSASVGPDVLLEIGAVDRPVVVRSADQGTFTTLVMPIRLDA